VHGDRTAASPRDDGEHQQAPAPDRAAALGDGGTDQAESHRPPAAARPDQPTSRPLAGDVPGERHRLPRRATRYWRWRAFFSAVPTLALLVALAIVVPLGTWWVRWSIVGIAAVLVVVGMAVLPPIRYRVFWYAISPTEIDVQHGIIFVKRSVVPMHRVQSLRTERGPIADHYRMTNLKIRTAAGSVDLSGLDRREADDVCLRISELSDVADDV